MKEYIASFAIGATFIFATILGIIGMKSAFGEAAGPVFLGVVMLIGLSFLIGKFIRAVIDHTPPGRAIEKWVRS